MLILLTYSYSYFLFLIPYPAFFVVPKWWPTSARQLADEQCQECSVQMYRYWKVRFRKVEDHDSRLHLNRASSTALGAEKDV